MEGGKSVCEGVMMFVGYRVMLCDEDGEDYVLM